jgi:transcriptional regulator with XRE-family HTH domain
MSAMADGENESKKPDAPPEGELIRKARNAAGLSIRAAAERTGISEGRWRQIESGYQSVTQGVFIPTIGPANTLAKMAKTVDLTPEALEKVGRADAADELRGLNEIRAVRQSQPDGLDQQFERFKADPKARRLLEKMFEAIDIAIAN